LIRYIEDVPILQKSSILRKRKNESSVTINGLP
jgi:hypothetical protein